MTSRWKVKHGFMPQPVERPTLGYPAVIALKCVGCGVTRVFKMYWPDEWDIDAADHAGLTWSAADVSAGVSRKGRHMRKKE